MSTARSSSRAEQFYYDSSHYTQAESRFAQAPHMPPAPCQRVEAGFPLVGLSGALLTMEVGSALVTF